MCGDMQWNELHYSDICLVPGLPQAEQPELLPEVLGDTDRLQGGGSSTSDQELQVERHPPPGHPPTGTRTHHGNIFSVCHLTKLRLWLNKVGGCGFCRRRIFLYEKNIYCT